MEPLKNGGINFGRVLCEESTDFACETNSNFNGIICWPFKEKDEDLECDNLMCDRLVD